MSLLQVHKNEEVTNNLDGIFSDIYYYILTFQEQFRMYKILKLTGRLSKFMYMTPAITKGAKLK